MEYKIVKYISYGGVVSYRVYFKRLWFPIWIPTQNTWSSYEAAYRYEVVERLSPMNTEIVLKGKI